MSSPIENLLEKIRGRSGRSAVIGVGYVGLPLAVEIAKAGFQTIGIDISEERVRAINNGNNYIADIEDQTLKSLVEARKLFATTDFSCLRDCDFVSICVPTPLGKGKDPDMSCILRALEQVKKYLRKGQGIVLESTTYPGTTQEVVLPLLEETGLKVGLDFFLAFSPERIDPGNRQFGIKNTPKIVGGITPHCTEIIQGFYQTFVTRVIPLRSPQTAEMVKMLENTFRAINIGLANEVAMMCNHLGIDTWEVIEAAATKPFGFMPFYPGPGLGGHCIPVDPHYLGWKLRSMNYQARFIQLADEINSRMPEFVVEKISSALNHHRKCLKGSRILVLGVSYKKDVKDSRESPALDVIRLLMKKGARVSYHDPQISQISIGSENLVSVHFPDGIPSYDCVTILADHSFYDFQAIGKDAQLVVDTRNAMRPFPQFMGKVVSL